MGMWVVGGDGTLVARSPIPAEAVACVCQFRHCSIGCLCPCRVSPHVSCVLLLLLPAFLLLFSPPLPPAPFPPKLVTPSPQTKPQNTKHSPQIHGGAGVSQDTVLAHLYAAARTLRIADGPDEVHLGTLAKLELEAAAGGPQALKARLAAGGSSARPRL